MVFEREARESHYYHYTHIVYIIQNTHTHKHKQVRFADALVVLREVNLESLEDPDTALCFWLNVYHTLLVHATMLFGPPLTRWKLWSELCYDIGGCPFSLLEIEHCVLRARLSKPRHQPLARFFLPKSFVRGSRREEMSRCVPKDSRINFVLNSGSISCLRAIPVFQESKLDEQLTRASVAFLRKNLVVDISTCTIILPAILSWYKNDFAQEDEKRVTKRDCALYIARLLLKGGRMERVGGVDGESMVKLLKHPTYAPSVTVTYGNYEWKRCWSFFESED